MMFLADLLANVGTWLAQFASQGCIWVWLDEPKCPKSLIK